MRRKMKDVPVDSVEQLKNLFSKIKGCQLKDIFSTDKIGLFFHLIYTGALPFKGDHCHGGAKKTKYCLIILLCINADVHQKR